MTQFGLWANEHPEIVFPLFLCGFLVIHFYRALRGLEMVLLMGLMTIVAVFAFVAFMFEPVVYIKDVFLFTAVFGISLYIVLCEWLLRGAAQWLTRKRGDKWVKELDYFYLVFGLVGILGSVNRLDVVGRVSKADILAPLFLVTAIVIRFIKTRADIGGWNKL
jgi:hypothetical protein